MLIAIVLLFGGVVGVGHAIGIYHEIKHDRERRALDARAAKERATRRIFL